MSSVNIISKRSALKNPKLISTQRNTFFLSDDISAFHVIKEQITDSDLFRTLDEIFHETEEVSRHSFQEITHRVSQEQADNKWYWISILGTRSTMESPLYRYYIYVIAAKCLIKKQSEVDFVVDHPVIAELLAKVCEELNIQHKQNTPFLSFTFFTFLHLKNFVFALNALLQNIWYLFRLKKLKIKSDSLASERPKYLIRSWYEESSFKEDGSYIDRNFGSLFKYLSEQSIDVYILPIMWTRKNFYQIMKKAIRKGNGINIQFLVPEANISYFQFLKFYFACLKLYFLNVKNANTSNLDFSKLLTWEHRRTIFFPDRFFLNNSSLLIETLARKKIKFDKFIYTFENNAIEKFYLTSIRQYFPNSLVVAYQHSVWYTSQPSMEILPEERKYIPLPDQIITSGRVYKDVLTKCGFPTESIKVGPNLRFNYIRSYPVSNRSGDYILLVLNYDMNEARDLIYKCSLYLNKAKYPHVLIKAHPLNDIKQLQQLINKQKVTHFKFVDKKLPELIQQARAVAVSGSSVANLEALAMDVPLIQVKPGSTTHLNPIWLEETPYLKNEVYVLKDLASFEQEKSVNKNALLEVADQVKNDYFEPVTNDTMKVFTE